MAKKRGTIEIDSDLAGEVREAILTMDIEAIKQDIYRNTIRYTINKKVNDSKGMEACKTKLEELQMRKDAYLEELEAIKAEKVEEK